MHEHVDSRHTSDSYCSQYIRITSEDIRVLLNKSQWACLMELASSWIDRHIVKPSKLYDELNSVKISVSKLNLSYTAQRSATDFETIYDEIKHKTIHW